MKREASFVYFIRLGEDGPIKVGNSVNPARRMAELRGWFPYELKFLGQVPGTLPDEEAIHVRFADHWIRGEWYEATQFVLTEVSRIIATKEFPSRQEGQIVPWRRQAQVSRRNGPGWKRSKNYKTIVKELKRRKSA